MKRSARLDKIPRRVLSTGTQKFVVWLAGVVAVGVIVRVYYTVRVAPWPPPYDDEVVFHLEALSLSKGQGFTDINASFHGLMYPGASHPPFYPLVLAVLAKLGGTDQETQRLAGSAFGAGTIVFLGLLGRHLAGVRVGLLAAGIAALYPMFITADGSLMSESLYGLLVAASLLAAYRLLDSRAVGRAIILGALLGFAALTRGEALLLVPLLLIPVFRQPDGRRAVVITCLTTAVVITPWSLRNWNAFHRPVLISTNLQSAVAGANCHSTYNSSTYLGSWDNSCIKDYPGDEAARWGRAQDDAINYAAHHLSRLPLVATHRLLRVWGLEPSDYPVALGGTLPQIPGRDPKVSEIGFLMYDVLVILAIFGFVVLRRRAVRVWLLMTTFVLVTVNALLIYGDVRFRQPAELSLVVLAAVALDQLSHRITMRHDVGQHRDTSAQTSQ